MDKTKLIAALVDLQSNCIGLARNPYTNSFELIIEENDSTLTLVTIGELGGLSTTIIPKYKWKYKRFPEHKSLLQMMENPIVLDEFCRLLQLHNWIK